MTRKTTKTPAATPTPTKYDAQAEKVLNLLIAKLEAGVNSWRKPWDCKGNPTDNADYFAVNLFTGKPYSGINAQTLPAGLYAGFSQIAGHGGKVKKGSTAYPVTWFGSFEKDLEDEQEQQKVWEQFDANEAKLTSGKYGACYQIRIGFYGVYNVYLDEDCDLEKVTCICKVLKFESVFHVEDTEGLEKFVERWHESHKPTETTKKPFNEIEAGDLWIEAYCEQAKLAGFYYDGGNRSYYIPSRDEIHVSKRTNYHTPADFYSTAFHEMTHSTGHASRLSRVGITNSDGFGGDRYAKEELIAEMGASMAMGFLGIETSGTLDNSAAYLASWLHQKVNAKASKKALETLMAASSSAKFAFAYIAEMYEAAKARKEEENKQKKTEEPAPLPMLPAIIAPTAATGSAAVFKAEPSDLTSLSDYEVALQISVASEQGDEAYLAALMAEKERRYQATKAEQIEITNAEGLGYADGLRIRGCFFPSLNKNNTIEEYKEQVTTAESVRAKGGNYPDDFNKAHAEEFSAWNVAIIQKFIQMDGEQYEQFAHSLLKDRSYLAGLGGSQLVNIDTLENAEMPEGVKYYDLKRLHQMRLAWATVCVMVCNKDNQEAILVDPEGFEYARYVGFLPDSYNMPAPKAEEPKMSDAALNMVKTIKEHMATNPNEVPTEGATLFDLIDFGNSYQELKEDKLFADWLKEHNLAMTFEKGFCTSFKWQYQQVCYRLMPDGEESSPTAPAPLAGVTQKFDICYHYGKENKNEVMETIDAINLEEAQRYADKLTNHIMSGDQLEGDYYFAKYQNGREEALSEFWVNIEDSTAVRVREGDGMNLSDEDKEAGYVDYIYYDTFEACDGLNIAERAENDENSDGGMILLEKPYKSYTTQEIASKVVDFIYGMVGSHSPDWKWSEDAPKFEEPDPEHYNDGMIDLRNIQEFCCMVFTNRDGDTKVVGYDDNFFAPCDLLEAYKSIWPKDWGMDDKKELYINKFKEYLIATGCSAEELEDNDQ